MSIERMSVEAFKRTLETQANRKYANRPVNDPVHGWFQSTIEHRRYLELVLEQKLGFITALERQHRIALQCGGVLLRSLGSERQLYYVSDFVYMRDGKRVIEDTKGAVSDFAALKAAIVRAMGYEVHYLKWQRGSWVRIQPVRSHKPGRRSRGKT